MQILATEELSRPEFLLWDFVEAVVICYVEGNVCVFYHFGSVQSFTKSLSRASRRAKKRLSAVLRKSEHFNLFMCSVM